jgi:drug/metabolite transporter (DMT)-like permease
LRKDDLKLRNWLLFAFLVFLWGSNWSASKVGLGFTSPTTFVLHRFIAAAIAFSPVILVLRKKIPRDRDTLRKLLIYSLIYVSQIVLIQVGLLEESSGMSSVLTFTQPLFVFCLAIAFLREKVTAVKCLGVIVGFAGVAVLLLGKTGSLTLGSSLMLILGGFLWAVTIVYYKKFLILVDPFVATFFQLSIGVLPLVVIGLFNNSFVLLGETVYLVIIFYSSVGSLIIGAAVWFLLLREEEATVLSGSSFLIPLVAMLFGWQLLGETIYTQSLFGAVIVLVGVCLVNFRPNTNRGTKK